jgi:hypothetical protein
LELQVIILFFWFKVENDTVDKEWQEVY